MQELIIPSAKSDKQRAKQLDKTLRSLAHADAARGIIMFELRMPGEKDPDRPLFQYLDEHGMTPESTFTDYIETVHNVTWSTAKYDLQAAIVWAAIQGLDPTVEISTLAQHNPPPCSHLRELHRLVEPEMEKIPNARGENRNFPVRAKNAGLIKEAWEYVVSQYEKAVEEHESNGADTPAPKLTSGFIRDRLSDERPAPNKPCFYTQAGKEVMKKRTKGRIGKLTDLIENLTRYLNGIEEYKHGIKDIAEEDKWSKTHKREIREKLNDCRDALTRVYGRIEQGWV